MSVFVPKALPILPSETAELAAIYGTKGAFLAALPPAWTPPFALFSYDEIEALGSDLDSALLIPEQLLGHDLIIRSSVVGETIWDRGTFLSLHIAASQSGHLAVAAIRQIHKDMSDSRPSAKLAIIVQRYLPDCEKGTLGNLNRLSKTREQWSRFSEVDGLETIPHRFNSQRDQAADPRVPLIIDRHVPLERKFGSSCRWLIDRFSLVLGKDRMLLEWAIADGQVYLFQCDLDQDNDRGVDPATEEILSRLVTNSEPPKILRSPTKLDIAEWDKLKILDELATEYSTLPQKLFFLPHADAKAALDDLAARTLLESDFDRLFGSMAVIRVTRKTGANKTTNLPCSSSCLSAEAALKWLFSQISETPDDEIADRAFVVHKYIGARAGAWALYEPDSPYVQIHANWGLPDSLQYYPYDAWDVHIVTEDLNLYPSYKSHFLWPTAGGDWTFKEIRNSLGRHQCLKNSEVLEIARKTAAIGEKLGRRVAVMWFAGVETEAGSKLCLPWYRTFDYAAPDVERILSHDHLVVKIEGPDDLTVARKAFETHSPARKIALDLMPSDHLVRERGFLNDIISLAQGIDAPVIYSGSPYAHPYYQLHGKVSVYLKLHRKSFRTRSRIKFHKLVRDRIPERIKSKYERVVYANLTSSETLQLLTGKLIEESQELIAAEGQDATAEELADVYEVLRGMMHQAGIDEASVIAMADAKRNRVGGFDRGIFLMETSLPKPGEAIVENRDVEFETLVREEYSGNKVLIPFALIGRLSLTGARSFPVPGTDKAVKFSPGRDGVEISLEQLEMQLEIDFPAAEDEQDDHA